jgi:histone arginine demethylase JMJD6
VFDSAFDDKQDSKDLLTDYALPRYFEADLFKHVPDKRRPPYRWFLIGATSTTQRAHPRPPRPQALRLFPAPGPAGHQRLEHAHQRQEALGAVQARYAARRSTVSHPAPGVPKKLAKGVKHKRKGEDGEAITYFEKILPRIKEEERTRPGGPILGESCIAATPTAAAPGMVEIIQHPGETIFVPGGWWHAVVNLTDTIACTQNYVSVRESFV